jgi:hypothetical protein
MPGVQHGDDVARTGFTAAHGHDPAPRVPPPATVLLVKVGRCPLSLLTAIYFVFVRGGYPPI